MTHLMIDQTPKSMTKKSRRYVFFLNTIELKRNRLNQQKNTSNKDSKSDIIRDKYGKSLLDSGKPVKGKQTPLKNDKIPW